MLATYIGGSFSRVLIIDSKDDDNAVPHNAAVVRSVKEAYAALPGRVVYRPSRDEMPKLAEHVDVLLDKIIRGGGRHALVIHEIFDLADANRMGSVLSECYRKGRSLFIPILTCTQRPVDLPRVAVDQVEHVMVFFLMDRRAREAAVPFAGDRAREPIPRDYSFWYRGPNDSDCRLIAPIALDRGGRRNAPGRGTDEQVNGAR